MIILLVPFLVFWHWFEPAAKKNLQGVKAYREKKYEAALEQFMSARGINPDMPQLKNNTAAALYQMKKYKEALAEFSQIDPEKAAKKSAISKQDLFYNLGNSFYRTDQYEKALTNYKKALVLNPSDMDLKKNYELTLKKMQEQQQQQKQDKKDDQQKDQKDQQKDKQDPQQDPQQDQQQKEKKHQDILQYLTQQEKEQQKKAKSKGAGVVKNEKDW